MSELPEATNTPAELTAEKKLELDKISHWLSHNLMPRLAADFPEAAPQVDRMRDRLAVIIDSVDQWLNPRNMESGAVENNKYLGKVAVLAASAAQVIALLEDAGEYGKLSGPTKKGIATSVILAIYDTHKDFIRIPWIPAGGRIERGVLQFLCDYGIEIGVAVWNMFAKK